MLFTTSSLLFDLLWFCIVVLVPIITIFGCFRYIQYLKSNRSSSRIALAGEFAGVSMVIFAVIIYAYGKSHEGTLLLGLSLALIILGGFFILSSQLLRKK